MVINIRLRFRTKKKQTPPPIKERINNKLLTKPHLHYENRVSIENTSADLKTEYEKRKGFWNGSVYFDDDEYPVHKGHCDHCGVSLEDYDLNYTEETTKFCLCSMCFKLYKTFTPVIVHHCPGCVEDGGDKRFLEWHGLEDFLERCPPNEGWHYEFSLHTRWDYRRNEYEQRGHIMDVTPDGYEWWVLWNIEDQSIIRDCMKLPLWKAKYKEDSEEEE